MRIQVNSDKNIAVDTGVQHFIDGQVDLALGRFKDKLTRVEVHLSDVNSHRAGKQDKRCLIEARPAGHRPLAVTTGAATVKSAVKSSLAKLRTALETFFGRMNKGRKGARRSVSTPVAARAAGKKIAVKRSSGSQPEAGAPRRRRRTPAAAAVAPRRKRTPAAAAARTAAGNGRVAPKKKPIYRARRKAWPVR